MVQTFIIGLVGAAVKPGHGLRFAIITFSVSNLRLEMSPNR